MDSSMCATTHPVRDVRDQFLGVALPAAGGPGAEIDEVPALGVAVAHDLLLGRVQQGQELVEEALLPLGAELEVEPPHAAAEDGEPVVHVLPGRHPQRDAVVVVADGGHQALDAVRVGDVLEGLTVEVEPLGFAPVGAVGGVDGIPHDQIVGKGFGETLRSGLVFRRRHDADGGIGWSGC